MQTWSLSRFERAVRRPGHGAEVLTAGRIDLDDTRAEVLEHETAERPGEELGRVDDEHAVERERRARARGARPGAVTVAVDGSSEPGVADSTAGSPGPVVRPSSPGTASSRSLAATVSLAAQSSRVCTGA